MDLPFNPIIKGHRYTKDWTCAVSGVRNEDGGVLRERESQRGERISAVAKTWGGGRMQKDGKVEKRHKDVKRSEGEKRERGRRVFFSLGKDAAALTCPPPPPESLPHHPSHWGLIKGLQAVIHSLSNHLSDMQFHQRAHWDLSSYCTGNTDALKQEILILTEQITDKISLYSCSVLFRSSF